MHRKRRKIDPAEYARWKKEVTKNLKWWKVGRFLTYFIIIDVLWLLVFYLAYWIYTQDPHLAPAIGIAILFLLFVYNAYIFWDFYWSEKQLFDTDLRTIEKNQRKELAELSRQFEELKNEMWKKEK